LCQPAERGACAAHQAALKLRLPLELGRELCILVPLALQLPTQLG
jgi:hypothetical protein